MAALASWSVSQGIYSYDADMFESLWETPITADLPVNLFYRLPEWCVYIVTPRKESQGRELYGFFVHLEHDANTKRTELRLLLDTETGLVPQILHLRRGISITEAMASAIEEGVRVGREKLMDERVAQIAGKGLSMADETAKHIQPLVSLTLYLCSVANDVRDTSGSERIPARPKPKKVKGGERLFPPDRPTNWEVGYRIGASIRRAVSQERSFGSGTGTHASPAPHIRRAHWHSFWIGQKDKNRELRVKWLPPIPVGVKDFDDLTPTVRSIES